MIKTKRSFYYFNIIIYVPTCQYVINQYLLVYSHIFKMKINTFSCSYNNCITYIIKYYVHILNIMAN